MKEWQSRALDRVYPVIFFDAIVCKVRHEALSATKPRTLPSASTQTAGREVLGIWVETADGAKFWLRVMNEIKARGVKDVPIVVCDGLVGLPAAVTSCWPTRSCRPASCT